MDEKWISALPNRWCLKQIRHIFRIHNGATPKSGESDYWNGDINWITPEDLGNNDAKEIAESRRKITPDGYANSGVSLAPAGSIAISTRAPIGHLAKTTIPSCVNQGCRLLEPKEGDSDYWYYASIAVKPILVSRGQGTTFMELPRQSLASVKLPVPPDEEQTAIARFLDFKTAQIDALIAKKKALLDKLAEKRTALISHSVTKGLDPSVPMKDSGVAWLGEIPANWELVKLGRKIQLQRGVDITKGEQADGDVPVVSSGGIASFHNVAYAKGPGVIVGRKGTVGAVYYVGSDYWPHDTTLWVKSFGGNMPRYVFYKLAVMDLASFDTGSSNPTINRNLVHPTVVSWPPMLEQIEIADHIDRRVARIERQRSKINSAILLLKEYRSALITNAVTGKIDLRGFQIPSPSIAMEVA